MKHINNEAKLLQEIGQKIASSRHLTAAKLDTIKIATGISKKVLSQVENGRYTSLKVTTPVIICQHLEISLTDLFSD
jgi:DNA-binding Xre family transcriptional regulator